MHASLFSSPHEGEVPTQGDPHADLTWLDGGTDLDTVEFSFYPSQYGCSWLCAHLGHCNFLPGIWKSYKGVLVLMLLYCCFHEEMRSVVSYSTILLMSLQHCTLNSVNDEQ